jgi:hypothetical protein
MANQKRDIAAGLAVSSHRAVGNRYISVAVHLEAGACESDNELPRRKPRHCILLDVSQELFCHGIGRFRDAAFGGGKVGINAHCSV